MELININQGRIFTSRELASWTNRNHNQVLKDIRREIDQLKKDPQMHCFIEGNFALVKNTNSEDIIISNTHYLLTRVAIQQMAMKYDAIIRAKINLRLEQLEEEIKKLQAEKMILLEEKASYYDKLIDTGLCLNLRDTSKELNIPERKFINFLLKKKYLYRNISGGLRPFSKYAKTELLY